MKTHKCSQYDVLVLEILTGKCLLQTFPSTAANRLLNLPQRYHRGGKFLKDTVVLRQWGV